MSDLVATEQEIVFLDRSVEPPQAPLLPLAPLLPPTDGASLRQITPMRGWTKEEEEEEEEEEYEEEVHKAN